MNATKMNPTSEVGLAQSILSDEEGWKIVNYIFENKFSHPSSPDKKVVGLDLLHPVYKRYDEETNRIYGKDCAKFLVAALYDKTFARQHKVLIDVVFQASKELKLNPQSFFSTKELFQDFWKDFKGCAVPFLPKSAMSLDDLKWALKHSDENVGKDKDTEE